MCGVQEEADKMPVVPIDSDYSNIPEFVDSLFSRDTRSESVIDQSVQQGKLLAPFSNQGKKITLVWRAAWRKSIDLPYEEADYQHCPKNDRIVVSFLSRFIVRNRLLLHVPVIEPDGIPSQGNPAKYILRGYSQADIATDPKVVDTFLELLLLGAHFVFVQDPSDLPSGVSTEDYYQRFRDAEEISAIRRRDPGNSHYTSVVNRCGFYAPNVNSKSAPSNCPFLVAYLVCLTDSSILCNARQYSTFMQLEGWQAMNARHNADYEIHRASLWNISTFGACAYSEKRGTTIFLAPEKWKPIPNSDTIMPPYAGAETRQEWLRTDLIRYAP